MNSLLEKNGFSIPSLYVKSAPRTYDIRAIFQKARYEAPCLLIFEDIDTIVTPGSRSYFFNEVDGLENNDGLFMVASTNHLDQLDPGLSSRPSRFDRKYLFPLPSEEERVLYCEYWRQKLKSKPAIQYPKKLSPAIASITQDFSFAYLKEAFVATLLVIAGHRSEVVACKDKDNDDGDLDDFELWREMKKQVKLLRDDMGTKQNITAKRSRSSNPDRLTQPDQNPSIGARTLPFHGRMASRRAVELPLRPFRVPSPSPSSRSVPGYGNEDEIQTGTLMTDDGMLLDSAQEH